jgi:hypothetical protein
MWNALRSATIASFITVVANATTTYATSLQEIYETSFPGLFERTTDYLVTLTLALFAIVGFFGKDTWGGKKNSDQIKNFSAGIFVLLAIGSLFCAYRSHMELISKLFEKNIDAGTFTWILWQAGALLGATFSAGVFVIQVIRTRT